MKTPIETPHEDAKQADVAPAQQRPAEKLIDGILKIREEVRARAEQARTAEKEKKRSEQARMLNLYLDQGGMLAKNLARKKSTRLPFGKEKVIIHNRKQLVDAIKCLFRRIADDFEKRKTNTCSAERMWIRIPDYDPRRIATGTGASGFFFPEYEGPSYRDITTEEMEKLKEDQKMKMADLEEQTVFTAKGYQRYVEGFARQVVESADKNGTDDDRKETIETIVDILGIEDAEKFCKFKYMEQVIDKLIELIKNMQERMKGSGGTHAEMMNVQQFLDQIHEYATNNLTK